MRRKYRNRRISAAVTPREATRSSHHAKIPVVRGVQLLIFGEGHLRRVLANYVAYYNHARTHLALHKDAPSHRLVQRSGAISAIPILARLHHQYVRM